MSKLPSTIDDILYDIMRSDDYIEHRYYQEHFDETKKKLEQIVVDTRLDQAKHDLQVVFDTYSGAISPDFAFELMKERINKLMQQVEPKNGA